MIRTSTGDETMNLSANDFENRELSIEELDAIAGGSFLGSIWHGAESVASDVGHFFSNPTTLKVLAVVGTVAGTIFGGWANQQLNPGSPTRLN
jgi:hypothetical protein